METIKLSKEQQEFLGFAQQGHNILVDACIGSGKTTAIQSLCNVLGGKRILYLTYNKLLKLDAKDKIKNKNVTVTNYHGFAFSELIKIGMRVAPSEQIQKFLQNKDKLRPICYDVLIIDEYQDIEQEIADMLDFIKMQNTDIQIIAVGDMEQKIYDKTTLDVQKFMQNLLGDYKKLHFTQCFRLSEDLAKRLGDIWHKKIVGVNNNCRVETMDEYAIVDFLALQKCSDILCLGARVGKMTDVLNSLEAKYPDKFNKRTVYASIMDKDCAKGYTDPKKTSAIFTTYDSSKGLERKICVVFDWTEEYWGTRMSIPGVKYEILRNIFCVAASRGKDRIIFVKTRSKSLSDNTIATAVETKTEYSRPFSVSEMFSFKYKEDVEECYNMLDVKQLDNGDRSEIKVKSNDGLIDLSPCIGILQEAAFFKNYSIDDEIIWYSKVHDDKLKFSLEGEANVEEKVLYLTACETSQDRYFKQVNVPFVDMETLQKIKDRLSTRFTEDEVVQKNCDGNFRIAGTNKEIGIKGRIDVYKDDIVYELKFVSELSHEHFLQCATYLALLRLDKGILWNIRTNDMYEICVPDRTAFLKCVVKTITKGNVVSGSFV